MKALAAAALTLTMLLPATAAEADLQISRAGTRSVAVAPAQNFTGAVKVEMLHTPTGLQRASAGSVSFAPGARTAWHGAAPGSPMTHLAITEALDGKTVDWQEHVGDAQHGITQTVSAAPAQPSRAQQLMGDVAPKLAQLTDDVLFGDVWARPGLSPRDRKLVTVSALIALNRPEHLRSRMALARTHGVAREELVETLTHLAFHTGWPNAITAFSVVREVFAIQP